MRTDKPTHIPPKRNTKFKRKETTDYYDSIRHTSNIWKKTFPPHKFSNISQHYLKGRSYYYTPGTGGLLTHPNSKRGF